MADRPAVKAVAIPMFLLAADERQPDRELCHVEAATGGQCQHKARVNDRLCAFHRDQVRTGQRRLVCPETE